jgi:signal peptide peptidase SppA
MNHAEIWAIAPEYLPQLVSRRLAALQRASQVGAQAPEPRPLPTAAEMAAELAGQSARDTQVAVLRISDVLVPNSSWIGWDGNGIPMDALGMAIDMLAGDPKVAEIILNFDSPGGSVPGLRDLADKVAAAADAKRVTAVANVVCCSAAYYLAAQAHEIVVAANSMTGSIGVIQVHVDASGFYEKMGLKITELTSVPYKAELSDAHPLTEEAQAELQRRIDMLHAEFEAAVATGRGVTIEQVQADFGQGRFFFSAEAVSRGLADREGTLEQVIAEAQARAKSAKPASTKASRARAIALARKKTGSPRP